ncbi:hypothetical protein VKS41_001410 [Umbelopsis sp. WA50703]
MALSKALHERDQLLLVFVHGFRGSEASFYDFPDSVRTVLTNSLQIDVDAVVYPSYRTQGNLKQAVDGLSAWLIDETQKREAEIKRLGGNGQVLVVLMAHSMGGIVSAETILHFQPPDTESQKTSYSLSRTRPNIIGLIAYDTPYYSLNHNVVSKPALEQFKQVPQHVSAGYQLYNAILPASAATATAATSTKRITDSATKATKSRWGLYAGLAAGVAATAAVAATAYVQRDRVTGGVTYLTEHLQFVSALANLSECRSRMQKLTHVPNLVFRCFYTRLPPNEKSKEPRTFIANPPEDTARYFEPADSSADGEIAAHTGMFDPSTNSNCYTLRNSTVKVVTQMVHQFEEWRDQNSITDGNITIDPENTATEEKITTDQNTKTDENVATEGTTATDSSTTPDQNTITDEATHHTRQKD